MGYFRELDEMSDKELVDEIKRRRNRRQEGKCAYCGQPFGCENPCRLHDKRMPDTVVQLTFGIYENR